MKGKFLKIAEELDGISCILEHKYITEQNSINTLNKISKYMRELIEDDIDENERVTIED